MGLSGVLVAVVVAVALVGLGAWYERRRRRLFLESHSVDADQLHAILFADGRGEAVQVIDVRQPLDLLAYSEIIPGARRIPPKEILENPEVVPRDQPTVVYCTCPSDATSIKIMRKALALGFEKMKFLRGGLGAWKEKKFPVEPYKQAFHLDTPA